MRRPLVTQIACELVTHAAPATFSSNSKRRSFKLDKARLFTQVTAGPVKHALHLTETHGAGLHWYLKPPGCVLVRDL